jgi:LysM repeat protein
MKNAFKIIFLASLILIGVSCSSERGDDPRHPLFIKGTKAKEKLNYADAEQAFIEYLETRPRSSKGHLELASLYDDNLDNPYKAIYHYKRYLELSPNSSDEATIASFIASSEKEIYERMSNGPVAWNKGKNEELTVLREKEKTLLAKIEFMRRENEQIRRAAGLQITSQSNPKKTEAYPAQTDAAPKTNAPAGKYPDSYIVQPGDNMIKIARKIYGDAKYYKKIFDANKDTLPTEDTPIKIGQKLLIPNIENNAGE